MARTRYRHPQPPPLSRLPAAAVRAVLSEGYSAADLRHDVLAGLVVGIVALPLSMALAIAVGVPPQPASVLAKAGVKAEPGRLQIVETLDEAAAQAQAHLEPPQQALPL